MSGLQLNNLNNAVQNRRDLTLRMNIKTLMEVKLRNLFENNMSADIKLSRSHQK